MIQQGIGYTYTNSKGGASLIIEQTPPAPNQPLTVYEDLDETGNTFLRVTPGTVNNVMPTIGGTSLDAATPPKLNLPSSGSPNQMVVIKCAGEKAVRFPTSATIEIVSLAEAQKDTDSYGYLAIASLVRSANSQGQVSWTIYPLVSGSVWAERRKLTEPNTAFYYFSRV